MTYTEPDIDDKNKNSMKTTKSEKAMLAILIPIGIYFLIMLIIAIAQFIQALW